LDGDEGGVEGAGGGGGDGEGKFFHGGAGVGGLEELLDQFALGGAGGKFGKKRSAKRTETVSTRSPSGLIVEQYSFDVFSLKIRQAFAGLKKPTANGRRPLFSSWSMRRVRIFGFDLQNYYG